jgi:hypothetical protein
VALVTKYFNIEKENYDSCIAGNQEVTPVHKRQSDLSRRTGYSPVRLYAAPAASCSGVAPRTTRHRASPLSNGDSGLVYANVSPPVQRGAAVVPRDGSAVMKAAADGIPHATADLIDAGRTAVERTNDKSSFQCLTEGPNGTLKR